MPKDSSTRSSPRASPSASELRRVAVRKFGAGQSRAGMTGPREHAAAAAAALTRAFTTESIIVRDRFRALMRESGVPEVAIEEFLRTAWIDDEAYLTDEPR